ncbi:MAG: 30S ribosomal protein S2 [Nanoarchaeota archaeon]
MDFPIPGNDDAIKSIKLIVETIALAYGEGKEEAGKIAEKSEAKRLKEAVFI